MSETRAFLSETNAFLNEMNVFLDETNATISVNCVVMNDMNAFIPMNHA